MWRKLNSMMPPTHQKLSLYYSPLCLFGQVARVACEEHVSRTSSDAGASLAENGLRLKLIEVPLGLSSPVSGAVYKKTPILVTEGETLSPQISPQIIEDYRMIWYEMYGRFLSAAEHAAERAILDTNTTELFYSRIVPLLSSPKGRRKILADFKHPLHPKHIIYRNWTVPLLIKRLNRKTSEYFTVANFKENNLEEFKTENLQKSKTAEIIDRAGSLLAQLVEIQG